MRSLARFAAPQRAPVLSLFEIDQQALIIACTSLEESTAAGWMSQCLKHVGLPGVIKSLPLPVPLSRSRSRAWWMTALQQCGDVGGVIKSIIFGLKLAEYTRAIKLMAFPGSLFLPFRPFRILPPLKGRKSLPSPFPTITADAVPRVKYSR